MLWGAAASSGNLSTWIWWFGFFFGVVFFVGREQWCNLWAQSCPAPVYLGKLGQSNLFLSSSGLLQKLDADCDLFIEYGLAWEDALRSLSIYMSVCVTDSCYPWHLFLWYSLQCHYKGSVLFLKAKAASCDLNGQKYKSGTIKEQKEILFSAFTWRLFFKSSSYCMTS